MRQVGTIAAEREMLSVFRLSADVGRAGARRCGRQRPFDLGVRGERRRSRWAELDEFNDDPGRPRYVEAQKEANQLRQAQIDKRRRIAISRDSAPRSLAVAHQPPHPLTMLLLLASVVATVLSDCGHRPDVTQWLLLSNVGRQVPELLHGQIWRLFTPMLLHLSWLHLLFNMYWLYILGSMIEIRRGTLVLAALVVISQVVGAARELRQRAQFRGHVGRRHALFGYCWMKSRFEPTAGIFVDPQTVLLMVVWLFVCLSGDMGPVANVEHFTGIAVGTVCGYVPIVLKR